MRQVSDLILIGDSHDWTPERRPVISACQTFHYRRHGWTAKQRPEQSHPNYLMHDDDNWLTLNWVDGPAALYEWGGLQAWRTAFRFLDRQHAADRPTLIHCDQGLSRAPTLAYAYMRKRGMVDSEDGFRRLYPGWRPGGIRDWLAANLDAL